MLQWSSPFVQTSAGEPLTSTSPFVAKKRSAWLVSKESPRLWVSKRSYTESATIFYRTPCRRLLTDSTQKTTGLQKPSVPNIMGRRNKRAGMPAYGQVGSATGGQRAAMSPWILQCVLIMCILWVSSPTLPEVFPCFSLSCKANARVKLTKTGHGQHSSKFVICVVLFVILVVLLLIVLFCIMFVCKCVLYCCQQVSTNCRWQIYHIINMRWHWLTLTLSHWQNNSRTLFIISIVFKYLYNLRSF
jgi:hypothetical protein